MKKISIAEAERVGAVVACGLVAEATPDNEIDQTGTCSGGCDRLVFWANVMPESLPKSCLDCIEAAALELRARQIRKHAQTYPTSFDQ